MVLRKVLRKVTLKASPGDEVPEGTWITFIKPVNRDKFRVYVNTNDRTKFLVYYKLRTNGESKWFCYIPKSELFYRYRRNRILYHIKSLSLKQNGKNITISNKMLQRFALGGRFYGTLYKNNESGEDLCEFYGSNARESNYKSVITTRGISFFSIGDDLKVNSYKFVILIDSDKILYEGYKSRLEYLDYEFSYHHHQVIDIEKKNFLDNIPHITKQYEQNACPICFDEFVGCQYVYQYRCNHIVCEECHPRLYRCPLCRKYIGDGSYLAKVPNSTF